MILIRLGIDGFGTGTLLGSGLDGGSQFISIRQLIAKLSSSSSAIFGVTMIVMIVTLKVFVLTGTLELWIILLLE